MKLLECKQDALVSFFLRVSLATVFLYAAVASFLDPFSWVGFLPQWLRNVFPETILLPLFSIYEMIVALWLLSGKKILYSAVLSGVTLLAIIVTNIAALDIVFRDTAIFFSAVSLVILHWPEIRRNGK